MTLLPPPAAVDAVRARLAALRQEHRDLDLTLQRLQMQPMVDSLQLQRLKKQKLQLKDHITRLEMMLVPDIHA